LRNGKKKGEKGAGFGGGVGGRWFEEGEEIRRQRPEGKTRTILCFVDIEGKKER